jgi:formate dehydrogenase major subunit
VKQIRFTLDGQQLEVESGTTILQAAQERGIFIPTFCHHRKLKPFASCFVCVVELEGRPNLVPSCSTGAAEGMIVQTSSERVRKARRSCVELLLSDHTGDCLGPCMTACPAGIDIPGFIKHIALGEDRKALELIKRNMPLPGVLGRVCPRPCEAACRRQLVDEPIAICQLKRYPADVASALGQEYVPATGPPTGKRVAIVGSGPAGLTVAYYLQILGHQCTIFEAHTAAGGMLRYGIPSYRLPRRVIDAEVAVIERMGARFRFNKRVGDDLSLEQVRRDYDAVFLSVGAQRATWLGIPGESLENVLHGTGFLGEVARDESIRIGRRVLVIGGGNAAIDSARTALRIGAEQVTILYRRTREEMPAFDPEVRAALEEGVRIEYLATPARIERSEDGTLRVTCLNTRLGEPDETGRQRPVPIEGSEHARDVDMVIAAIGQRVDVRLVEGIALSGWGTIRVDARTLETNLKGVFAGGDCVVGPDIVVNLVRMGRQAAVAIDQYLLGREVVGEGAPYNHSMGGLAEVPQEVAAGFDPASRILSPHRDPEARSKNFAEVEAGFTPEMARAEARRCMECGCRDARGCRLRDYASRFGADPERFAGERRSYDRDVSHPDIVYEAHKCIQCGTCVRITEEWLGTSALGFVNRGFAARVRPALGRPLGEVPRAGLETIVDECPVGALTLRSAPIPTLDPQFTRPDPGSAR